MTMTFGLPPVPPVKDPMLLSFLDQQRAILLNHMARVAYSDETAPATGIDAADIADGSVSNTEFQYLDGLTRNVQVQFDDMQAEVDTKVSNRDFSWEPSMWGMRVVKDPGSGSFSVSDVSLSDITDPDGVVSLTNFLDARIDRQLIQFVIPTELDITQTVSIVVYFRAAVLDANDAAVARLNFELRNIPVDALILSGGETISVSNDYSVADVPAGTLRAATFTAALTTTFLAGGTFVHGSFSRAGTHANDTYLGTIQLLNIQFQGKRKLT